MYGKFINFVHNNSFLLKTILLIYSEYANNDVERN